MFIPYPEPVDKKKFDIEVPNPEAKYGLPRKIQFCKNCVVSNQRPTSSIEFKTNKKQEKNTIFFDQDGVCDACRVKEKKSQINWEEREAQLRELCNRYRRKDGSYDCVVPGSGGKDSFMTAHLLKYKYGMNPLTCTWAPHIYTDWGWKNYQAWIHAGFDNILFTPNGRIHRLITRLAVDNIFHPFQPFFLGQKNLGPKIASLYDIPLVFYGEHEAEYGNAKKEINSFYQSSEYFSSSDEDNVFISGNSLSQLKEIGIKKVDLEPYMPLRSELIENKKIEVHYFGYYERWHPQGAYYYSVENGGFISSPERTLGTYSTYNSIDDRIDDFHYHTLYLKFGIGRATYDASQEIRSGDIVREEGVALVKKFDGEFPHRWADQIFQYLSLNENQFPESYKFFESPTFDRKYYDLLSENARSPHLWSWDKNNGWKLRANVHDNSNKNNIHEQQASKWEGNPLK